jgi:hypothetical protein
LFTQVTLLAKLANIDGCYNVPGADALQHI